MLAIALSSCTSDDFIGSTAKSSPNSSGTAISFSSGMGKITRAADKTGAEAAQALGNNFIVYGVKTKDNENTVISNYYNVNWIGNGSEATWVYAEQAKNALNTTIGEGKQTIKYWDYSAIQYDFTAFTLGSSSIKVERTEANNSPTYTFKGNYSDLQSCYIADRVKVEKANFGQRVKFTFHSTGTKVGVKIYETIPGYSIKEIKFYDGSTPEEEGDEVQTFLTPILYANSECIPENHTQGTLTVTYDDNNKAKLGLAEDKTTSEETTNTKFIKFNRFTLDADKEQDETSEYKYLGQTKNRATSTGTKAVSPCTITGGLTLKIDYTLISTDGSGEEIIIKGATAAIPETYTKWEANHIYTYIFKITQDTNGSTGGDVTGLHPIVFDAIVDENTEGSTTTETTFDKNGKGTTTKISEL